MDDDSDVKSLLQQIESLAEKILGRTVEAVAELEEADPHGTINMIKIAKHLGFELKEFDGTLVADGGFVDICKEALFLNGYTATPTARRRK